MSRTRTAIWRRTRRRRADRTTSPGVRTRSSDGRTTARRSTRSRRDCSWPARAERNDYPFIRGFGATWVARLTDFVDGEFGLGYRLSAATLLKSSVRVDRWWVSPTATGFRGQGGPAFALQISQSFDVVSWFARER